MATFQLLLLGLCVTTFLVTEGAPPGFTPAQWFNEQHVQYPKTRAPSDNVYCNNEMRRVNQHLSRCKDINSFLHYPLNDVIMVCFQPNINCTHTQRNVTRTNCHNSTITVPITRCEWIPRTRPCRYRGRPKQAYFIVACDPPRAADRSRSTLLPVHLDKA
ncbi:ribonuclease 8-like [Trichosurus vulpecula]|uniref:ribonuclease 8-like n=1 Tax=Trichosurus vulpecula TaxID=9337 RepID=UPI00186AC460|nr:ribonuclease 8-like [Trichosurus vulpecula]